MTDFAVVCFKWKPAEGYRSKFGPETVNTLRRMVKRNFAPKHRFICVTDDAKGLDRDVEVIPLWPDHDKLVNPHGRNNPSCYRRLKMFSPDAGKMFGPRFVALDLDCVIVDDLEPLWARREDFMIWGDTNPTSPYNGSMIMMTAGARPRVWTEFDPIESPKRSLAMGYFGSDQAWIGACLGPNETKWTRKDGVYSYRNEIGPLRQELPLGARIIVFHGQIDPWHERAQNQQWVRDHYR